MHKAKRLRAPAQHAQAPVSGAYGTLFQKARQLLIARQGISYLAVYVDTGLDPSWLSQFASGKLKDPGVNKVQKLYEYLTGKRLEV